MSLPKVRIKYNNQEIIIDYTPDLNVFMGEIFDKFKLQEEMSKHVSLTYPDEEGDSITISTKEDLVEAYDYCHQENGIMDMALIFDPNKSVCSINSSIILN